MSSADEVGDAILRATDDRPAPADDDGSLHQLGMLRQHRHHLIVGRHVGIGEPELGEVRVASHEIGRGILQLAHQRASVDPSP